MKYAVYVWTFVLLLITIGTKVFWLMGFVVVFGIIGGLLIGSSEKKEEETPPIDTDKINDMTSLKLADMDYYDDDDYDDLQDRLDDLEDRLQDLEDEREDELLEEDLRELDEQEREEYEEKIESLKREVETLKERNRQLHHAIKRIPRK